MNGSISTRTAYRPARRWEHDTAMLASSMMLVSISEDSPCMDVGYKSRLCPSPCANSRVGSDPSLNGWGSAATRTSCKTDLCSLAAVAQQGQQESSPPVCPPSTNSSVLQVASQSLQETSDESEGQDWFFFEEEDC